MQGREGQGGNLGRTGLRAVRLAVLVLVAGLLLVGVAAAQQGSSRADAPKRRHGAKGAKHTMSHPARQLSDREKAETKFLRADQKRQERLAAKQRRDAKRNTHRPPSQ